MKKEFKLLPMLLIIWVAILSLAVEVDAVETYDPLRPLLPTPADLGFPSDIPDVDMKTFDFRQTFNFPGRLGGASTTFDANHAYISPGFDNIITLVNGKGTDSQKASVWYKQKLNLNTEFDFSYYTYVGQNNVFPLGIGDGMTLTFHNDPAGINAIGGYGGGIGVYPIGPNQSNMIYNAVTIEIDTYENVAGALPDYDAELVSPSGIVWPHAAISSTKTEKSKDFSVNSINDAYANNTHYVPTFPTSRAQADLEWFSTWVKVHVRWVPSDDGIHGTLSYEVNDYGEKSQVIDIDAYWNSNGNSTTNARWDRKVVWGFTSSNHSSQRGNPVGILMDELPYEPKLEVERKVKNITANDLDYREATTAEANPGDILEYNVKVNNITNDEWGVPFTGVSHKESLEGNSYVTNSLSAKTTRNGITTPITMGVNVAAGNVLQTNLGTTTLSKKGDSYEYTYQIKVGKDVTKFENNLLLSNTYGPDKIYGKTTVDILPQNISISKTNLVANPKVGDLTKITLEAQVENGRLVIDSIEDSIPTGFEVIPSSTYIYEKGVIGPKTPLLDKVWHDNNLTIDEVDLSLIGGTTKNKSIVVEYMMKPLVAAKGQEIIIPEATIKGHNEFINESDKKNYTVNSKTVAIRVQTDAIISFKNKSDGSLISADKIISSDVTFNNTNPVVIYMNTGDSYDYTSIIKEISTNLFTNNKLHQQQIVGDLVSSGVSEDGSLIEVFYTEEVNMIISQVYKENNAVGIYDDLANKTTIDNSKKFPLKQGDKIEDILKNLTTKNQFKLNHQGYKELELDDYKIIVKGNPIQSDIVPNEDFILLFEYEGLIGFEETPKIDFGQVKIDNGSDQAYSPVNKDTEVKIINTTLTGEWGLCLSLPDGFKGASKEEYLGDITYNDKDKKQHVIGKTSQVIEKQMSNELIQAIDMKGDSSKNGLVIRQDIGNRKEKFSGKLLWSLEDTPEN